MLAVFRRCLAAVLLAGCAAHRGALTRPSCDGDFGSSATALPIADATISWSFKHYLDCTHRAVWMKFKNPSSAFKFYVGVGIPTMSRFAGLRADAIIIGPGLGSLSESEVALVPAEVKSDPIFNNGAKAILRRSPADQTTCAHLGPTMTRSSTVKNGRCDFHEPYGDTHSWRVLDADDNNIPMKGGDYYVAVWLQTHTSGKIGIAFGTWVENFWAPMDIVTPTCTRNMPDFSEKGGEQASAFPVEACSAGKTSISKVDTVAQTCTLGDVCASATSGTCSTSKYEVKMGCGGTRCPSAVELWDKTNMDMHKGMAIKFTGDVSVDFVRGMIPHHQGAVDMCKVMVYKLKCLTWEDSDKLDGLVHFCNHVNKEQERELAGMRAWLEARKLNETATCPMTHGGSGGSTGHGHEMSDGCGNMTTPSSKQFIHINQQMHAGMGINFSCSHDVDFVRGMIPHHSGAVGMCDILHNYSQPDAYLKDLCANITRLQRAEIAWMSKWLHSRSLSVAAPCKACAKGVTPVEPPMPCDNMLASTSFCHMIGGDFLCKCDSAIQKHACGSKDYIDGFGVLDMSAECQRTCGKCPAQRPPLFHESCSNSPSSHDHSSHGGSGSHSGSGMSQDSSGASTAPSVSAVGVSGGHRLALEPLVLVLLAFYVR